jgi:hypothetical protein
MILKQLRGLELGSWDARGLAIGWSPNMSSYMPLQNREQEENGCEVWRLR